MTVTTQKVVPSFIRDRFTWLAYFMLAFFAFNQAILGPLMPFLREELALNYTVSGLHVSAFALGMMLAGLFGERIANRFGRALTFWGGAAGMIAGSFLLISGRHPAVTILATLMMGTLGALLIVMINATLSDKHQNLRAQALTEANIVASVFAALSPAAVSIGQSVGLGWRSGFGWSVLLAFIMFCLFSRVPFPQETQDIESRRLNRALPRAFWVYWVVLFLGVSLEWCFLFWGASFLEDEIGLSKVNASGMMTAFLVAMVIGRVIGSRLSVRVPGEALLLGAVVLVLIGFPLFWLGPVVAVNIVGLFICGLGAANFFPLTLSVMANLVPEQANKVSARVTLGGGSAILITPQVLGTAADQIGIARAFGIAGLFAGIMLVLVFAAYRHSRTPA